MPSIIIGGREVLFDEEDRALVNEPRWRMHNTQPRAASGRGRFYVSSRPYKESRVYLHRLIVNAQPDEKTDHINRNTLDNRRANLRTCTTRQNSRNSSDRTRKTRPDIRFRGVAASAASGGGWFAEITADDGRVYLGTFDTQEEAARAYDFAARERHGEFATLNFPGEIPSERPRPRVHQGTGDKNARAKLTSAQIESARVRFANGETNVSIAREFGVDPSTLAHARVGVRCWRKSAP